MVQQQKWQKQYLQQSYIQIKEPHNQNNENNYSNHLEHPIVPNVIRYECQTSMHTTQHLL